MPARILLYWEDTHTRGKSSEGVEQVDRAPRKRGAFITFEGGDGAGKSTHIRFLADALRSQGVEVVCVREPGGTKAGEALRRLVLDPQTEGLCDEAELFIYEAARAQVVAEVIEPALARGAVVLCDRFYDSTVAYQACGRGLDRAFVEQANLFAARGLVPDRTVLMKSGTSAARGLARATHASGADRMEAAGLDFHERVNAAFDELAQTELARVRTVVSSKTKARTAKMVFEAVADVVGWDPAHLPFDDAYFEAANKLHGASKRRRARGGRGGTRKGTDARRSKGQRFAAPGSAPSAGAGNRGPKPAQARGRKKRGGGAS